MNNNEACAEYFRGNSAYRRCFSEFEKKWKTYGKVTGIITLKNTSEEERRAIGGILGKTFYENTIRFPFAEFEKGLQYTKFAPVDFEQVLEAYFGRKMLTTQDRQKEKRIMARDENVKIFQDTEERVKKDPGLQEAVKYSVAEQVLIPEMMEVTDLMPELAQNRDRYEKDAEIIVSKKRSYEAAAGYPGERVCVHNFASATNPGGGVTKGSSAQEECLCRCSTLYFCLNTKEMWAGFYSPHRYAQDPIHNDDCIYTPEVIVFKSDTATPAPLPESDWYSVNVITCAAPNLRLLPANGMNPGDGNKTVKMTRAQQQALHEKRLSRILDVAVAGGNEVVILGAFGCGAFENDPEAVAAAFSNVIARYRKCFKTIELAIYCSPRDEQNYNIFKREIDTILC